MLCPSGRHKGVLHSGVGTIGQLFDATGINVQQFDVHRAGVRIFLGKGDLAAVRTNPIIVDTGWAIGHLMRRHRDYKDRPPRD